VESTFVTIRRAIRISIDILFGLEHAHRQDILHRDVKPANFMLQGGLAKLSDFGLAANAAASLTASGAGSPVYCAPEVINDNITTEQTDIYAAGMSLFQLANNIRNLGARISSIDTIKMGRVISSIGYENYVPRRLRYVCNKACAPLPERRYQNVAEMRQAIERLRVKQDWTRLTPEFWQATIKGSDHQLTIEDTPPLEMVYRSNGRRKNANCKIASSVAEAANTVERWVYNNTF
jgi:serine/threonine-protein kinase